MFITFEGIEGSGKSTLVAMVETALRERGETVVSTREPGGTPVGDSIRELFLDPRNQIAPIAEALLVNASRAQLCADVIRPALRAGSTVLCDRFYDATIAYQGYGRELDIEGLLQVCLVATGGLSPDLTILLDVSPVLSRDRVKARATARNLTIDRMEAESPAFHERVRAGYAMLAERFSRFVVLDGTGAPERLVTETLEAIEHVRARIRSIVP